MCWLTPSAAGFCGIMGLKVMLMTWLCSRPIKNVYKKCLKSQNGIFDELDLIISFDHINPKKIKTKRLALNFKNDP